MPSALASSHAVTHHWGPRPWAPLRDASAEGERLLECMPDLVEQTRALAPLMAEITERARGSSK
jgi:hypothetical protein